MRVIQIRKRSGKLRTICVPDEPLKAALRALCPALEEKARAACPKDVLHGFTKGRSPVTNALTHTGRRYSLTFDLEDFFDTVTPGMVKASLTPEEIDAVFIDPADGKGLRPCQGLPTSPAVANLAASRMDKLICHRLQWADSLIVYTRYADDLTFSFDDAQLRTWLLEQIPQVASFCGFRINSHKTRFMPASAGRRHVTGVAVDGSIHPTRAAKRRLRVALHRHHAFEARGLTEWCALKPPKDFTLTTRPVLPTMAAASSNRRSFCFLNEDTALTTAPSFTSTGKRCYAFNE